MPELDHREPPDGGLPALLDEVRRLVLDLAETDLTEFELHVGPARVHLRQSAGTVPLVTRLAASAPVEPVSAALAIRSPLNGVFYARPNPNADVYIRVGDRVEPDQVVCLVEAMKSFNEIRAEVAGVVERVAVEDGQVVNAGDALIFVVQDAVPPAAAE